MKDGIECSFTAEVIVLDSDKAVIALLRWVDKRTAMLVELCPMQANGSSCAIITSSSTSQSPVQIRNIGQECG